MEFIPNNNFIKISKEHIELYGLEEAIIIAELQNEVEVIKNFETIINFESSLTKGGWVPATIENLKRNTGLGEFKQRKILKHLVELGVIEVERRGIPARRYIKLNEKFAKKEKK